MLLTRSPLGHLPEGRASLDLHVLSTPPAFVLSQDQTLRRDLDLPDLAARLVKIGERAAFGPTEPSGNPALDQTQTIVLSVFHSVH